MSLALVVAVTALLVVLALTLLQRRALVDHTRRAPAPITPAPPGAVAQRAPRDVPRTRRRDDAEFGPMTWDGEMWSCERHVELAGVDVAIELAGGADGPDAAHRGVMRALIASAAEIDGRARPMVVAELQRRGCPPEDPLPYEAAVGQNDDGRLAGWLWYCFGEFDGEIGVRSEDQWQTLTLEIIE